MASSFQVLLDATVRHLTDLQGAGTRFVQLDPATLARLDPGRAGSPVAVGSRARPASIASPPSRFAPPPVSPRPAPPPRPPLIRPRAVSEVGVVTPDSTGVPVPAPVGRPEALSPVEKRAALEQVRERALACVLCPHLVRSRTQVVWGDGDPEAELMFVGEAPGAEEDRQGLPFVGPAGQVLTKVIEAMGYGREAVYIANVLKCRPDLPPGMSGNRAPRPEEMETCKPYLLEQIALIRPKVIVTLGLTAVQGLLGVRTTLGAVRGRWQDFRGTPVMPTFHPAYLLRAEQGPDRGKTEKRKTWEDMLRVLERLDRPITERMRGFFRPSASAG